MHAFTAGRIRNQSWFNLLKRMNKGHADLAMQSGAYAAYLTGAIRMQQWFLSVLSSPFTSNMVADVSSFMSLMTSSTRARQRDRSAGIMSIKVPTCLFGMTSECPFRASCATNAYARLFDLALGGFLQKAHSELLYLSRLCHRKKSVSSRSRFSVLHR